MKFLMLLVLALMPVLGRSEFNAQTKLFWMPTQAEVDAHAKTIKAQDKAFNEAYLQAKASNEDADWQKAEALALFPVQRAWISANRGWALKDSGTSDPADLEQARTFFDQAKVWAVKEDKRLKGPSGSEQLVKSVDVSLVRLDQMVADLKKQNGEQ